MFARRLAYDHLFAGAIEGMAAGIALTVVVIICFYAWLYLVPVSNP